MIKLDNIKKNYDRQFTLHNLSLEIATGHTVAIIGTSGSGKSTVLQMLVGLITPDSGQITIDNKPLDVNNISQMRLNMGYMMQNEGLFPHLSAQENILLMPRYLQLDVTSILKRLTYLCDLSHFDEKKLVLYPHELSGGQCQRVSLMRALILDPNILLLDEPLVALDPIVRKALQTELKAIFNKLQKTVILVTHDIAEAIYLTQRIIVIHNGMIQQDATPQELLAQPSNQYVTDLINSQRHIICLNKEWIFVKAFFNN